MCLVCGLGGCGGSLNALLITRLRIPPLIVTLGSFSLFRGLAEGITRGVDNFTDFPASFLVLGNGPQVPIFIAAAILFWLLLHRSTVGRALSAIGYAPEGARHAGIPVERRLALVYVLCGLASGLAAVIYAARVGQAKADAGTGYELAAITAVVLGGTSIFGGRGSILGSLLGLFIIAILQVGLRMASGPGEAAGVLTGVLLLAAISIQWALSRAAGRTATAPTTGKGEFEMRNSQLAVLSVVILVAAAIIAGGNYLLVRSIAHIPNAAPSTSGGAAPASGRKLTIAMMPKSKGNAYFIACQKGAEEAAKELGVNLIWDGPTDPDPAKQNEIVDTWATRGVDVICVAAENGKGLSTALREARKRGIKVVTYDADAEPDARDFFVNQATPQGIGCTLMDTAARVMDGKRRRADAAMALGGYVREKAMEVCAVKTSKDSGLDARDWEPVGEENYKELVVRRGLGDEREAYLVVVDADGTAKACTQKVYPLAIALQLAWAWPLPTYTGRDGTLMTIAHEEAMRKAQRVAAEQEV